MTDTDNPEQNCPTNFNSYFGLLTWSARFFKSSTMLPMKQLSTPAGLSDSEYPRMSRATT